MFGLRGTPGMLFDLANDPGELDNINDNPLMLHGFAALLNGHIRDATAMIDFAAEGVEIPEDELRSLRALGYLQ
ncbi:MAG TPA: hypothetical protein QGG47_08360 [Acidobacteriota bacterium]|nr:hypothetical protein [Acidobacteriota bacterium]